MSKEKRVFLAEIGERRAFVATAGGAFVGSVEIGYLGGGQPKRCAQLCRQWADSCNWSPATGEHANSEWASATEVVL
jgi:hypothetical protein